MKEFSQNSTGGILRLTVKTNGVPKDLSGASAVQYMIKRADQTVIARTATFTTDGTDGVVEYQWIAGDLSQDGKHFVVVDVDGIAYSGDDYSGQSTPFEFFVAKEFVPSV